MLLLNERVRSEEPEEEEEEPIAQGEEEVGTWGVCVGVVDV